MSLPAGNDIPSDWRSVIAAIPEAEKTPLVRLLLQVIEQQAQRIGFLEAKVVSLEAEIVRLKGGPVKKPPASNSKPSELSKPAKPATEDGKRPGKEKGTFYFSSSPLPGSQSSNSDAPATCFFGRPRGSRLDSKPNSWAVFVIQGRVSNGRPR